MNNHWVNPWPFLGKNINKVRLSTKICLKLPPKSPPTNWGKIHNSIKQIKIKNPRS
jgi:hypothetical protein